MLILNPQVLVHLVESALLVGEGRLELWALNGDPYPTPENDTDGSGQGNWKGLEGLRLGGTSRLDVSVGWLSRPTN